MTTPDPIHDALARYMALPPAERRWTPGQVYREAVAVTEELRRWLEEQRA